jgi:signal transduction histidine kinase
VARAAWHKQRAVVMSRNCAHAGEQPGGPNGASRLANVPKPTPLAVASAQESDFAHAAIVDELNQPLAAIALGAEASLQWLTRENPNVPEAIKAIQGILRGVQRASRIAQGIRSLVATERSARARQSGRG